MPSGLTVFLDRTSESSLAYSLSFFESPLGIHDDHSRHTLGLKIQGDEALAYCFHGIHKLNPMNWYRAFQFTHFIERLKGLESDNLFMNATFARDVVLGGTEFAHQMKIYERTEEIDGGGFSSMGSPTHWKYIGTMAKERVFILDDNSFSPTDSLKTQTSLDANAILGEESTDGVEMDCEDTQRKTLKRDLQTFRFTPIGDLSDMPLALKYNEEGNAVYYVNHGLARFKPSYRSDVKRFAEYIDGVSAIPVTHKRLSSAQALDILSFSSKVVQGHINFIGSRL